MVVSVLGVVVTIPVTSAVSLTLTLVGIVYYATLDGCVVAYPALSVTTSELTMMRIPA